MGVFFDSNYGGDVAKENMDRYGFQGIYQKYLHGENQRMKSEEHSRIMRLATNLVPGQSNLRVNLAQQGLSGGASNVIAKQQREAGMDKALDAGLGMWEQSSNRLDQQFLGMTAENEKMRFGASQDYMKAMQMETEDENAFENSLIGGAMGIAGNLAGMGAYKWLGLNTNTIKDNVTPPSDFFNLNIPKGIGRKNYRPYNEEITEV